MLTIENVDVAKDFWWAQVDKFNNTSSSPFLQNAISSEAFIFLQAVYLLII